MTESDSKTRLTWLQKLVARVTLKESSKRPLVDPVIVHIHVPKCGGTAFRNFLKNHFGAGHLSLYVSDTFFVYSDEELAGYVADRNVQCISTHYIRTFPKRLAGRDLVYITFLRNPTDQFISYITYVKKNFQDLQHDQALMSCLPPGTPSLPIREIAYWILTRNEKINFHENFTVNFFAKYVLGSNSTRPDNSKYRELRLSTARNVLEGFLFVGLVEDMNRSVPVLRNKVRAIGLPFPEGEVSVENTSHDFRGDLSWINSKDDVGGLLLNSVREDQRLYQWARLRLLDREQSALAVGLNPRTS